MNRVRLTIGLCSIAAATALAVTQTRGAPSPTGKPSSRPALVQRQARPLPGQPTLDRERLRRAIKAQESGGCPDPYNARGDGGKSRGSYQFGVARWKEVSRARYPGTPAEQDAAMRNAITRYLRRAPAGATVEAQVKHCARSHNGWGKASIGYANDVWRCYCCLDK